MNVRVALVAAILIAAAATGVWFVSRARAGENYVQCANGFVRRATRCMPETGCPAPLTATPRGCDAPLARMRVPDTELLVGPSDWEAEGRVTPRTVKVRAFDLDAFEVTVGAYEPQAPSDLARAARGMTRDAAAEFCRTARGGRLPTDDEWLAAAAGDKGWRYPWGNTGAVCRRGAWGLAGGPCAMGATEPDTVGTHPEGDTPSHLHDLAGNVAEWVAGAAVVSEGHRFAYARGGSYATALATDLRTWSWLELDPAKGDPRVGFRCAYDLPP
jgi:formylglycine-generating enzyme